MIGTCATCKHWDPTLGGTIDPGWGDCTLDEHDPDGGVRFFSVWGAFGEEAGLSTRHDFGCVAWAQAEATAAT